MNSYFEFGIDFATRTQVSAGLLHPDALPPKVRGAYYSGGTGDGHLEYLNEQLVEDGELVKARPGIAYRAHDAYQNALLAQQSQAGGHMEEAPETQPRVAEGDELALMNDGTLAASLKRARAERYLGWVMQTPAGTVDQASGVLYERPPEVHVSLIATDDGNESVARLVQTLQDLDIAGTGARLHIYATQAVREHQAVADFMEAHGLTPANLFAECEELAAIETAVAATDQLAWEKSLHDLAHIPDDDTPESAQANLERYIQMYADPAEYEAYISGELFQMTDEEQAAFTEARQRVAKSTRIMKLVGAQSPRTTQEMKDAIAAGEEQMRTINRAVYTREMGTLLKRLPARRAERIQAIADDQEKARVGRDVTVLALVDKLIKDSGIDVILPVEAQTQEVGELIGASRLEKGVAAFVATTLNRTSSTES